MSFQESTSTSDFSHSAMNKDRINARLEEVDRKCDGCGTHIGRFTSKCYFDAEANRVYCSTGGCADKIRDAPRCSACGEPLDPFSENVSSELGGAYCSDCDHKAEGEIYQVRVVRPNWFQVVRPLPGGGVFVRSALADEDRANQLKDKFNTTL